MLGPSAESAQPLLLPLRKREMKHSTIVSAALSLFYYSSSSPVLLSRLLFCLLFSLPRHFFFSPVSLVLSSR